MNVQTLKTVAHYKELQKLRHKIVCKQGDNLNYGTLFIMAIFSNLRQCMHMYKESSNTRYDTANSGHRDAFAQQIL